MIWTLFKKPMEIFSFAMRYEISRPTNRYLYQPSLSYVWFSFVWLLNVITNHPWVIRVDFMYNILFMRKIYAFLSLSFQSCLMLLVYSQCTVYTVCLLFLLLFSTNNFAVFNYYIYFSIKHWKYTTDSTWNDGLVWWTDGWMDGW